MSLAPIDDHADLRRALDSDVEPMAGAGCICCTGDCEQGRRCPIRRAPAPAEAVTEVGFDDAPTWTMKDWALDLAITAGLVAAAGAATVLGYLLWKALS